AAQVGAGGQHDVGAAQCGELGDAEAGLNAQEQERMVASAEPRRAIGCREQRLDLDARERRDEATGAALRRNGEHSLAGAAVGRFLESDEAEERMDTGESRVARSRAVAA